MFVLLQVPNPFSCRITHTVVAFPPPPLPMPPHFTPTGPDGHGFRRLVVNGDIIGCLDEPKWAMTARRICGGAHLDPEEPMDISLEAIGYLDATVSMHICQEGSRCTGNMKHAVQSCAKPYGISLERDRGNCSKQCSQVHSLGLVVGIFG